MPRRDDKDRPPGAGEEEGGSTVKFAVFGAGFWAPYQLAGWGELGGVECVAVCDPVREKAEAMAGSFGIPRVYDDPGRLLAGEDLDFVDVISSPSTHEELVLLAAGHRMPVICQKPMAPDLGSARRMVRQCEAAGAPFFVHENWRWQEPLRAMKAVLDSGVIGDVFRARLQYSNSFPVFDNQPFLKEEKRFILLDIGVHILDVVRMLFGEASSLFCRTNRVNPEICGEDVATVMLEMVTGATVTCEMSYASRLEHDCFPETFALVEGERGSVGLGPDYWVRVTTEEGTSAHRHPPVFYPWADPDYALAQTSCVACNANILKGIQGDGDAETTGYDNLKTLELVFGSYESMASRAPVSV